MYHRNYSSVSHVNPRPLSISPFHFVRNVTLHTRNAVSCFHYVSVRFRCVLCITASHRGFKHVTKKKRKKREWKRKIDESSISESAREKESRNNAGLVKKNEWEVTESETLAPSQMLQGGRGIWLPMSSLSMIGTNIKIYLRISRKQTKWNSMSLTCWRVEDSFP
jgi:hypothetical protein